ncbi:GNAT family N-acetyltransferase [Streptomyces sodiiphilus]|uniref:GNAT family N-acetyltransferase n=1 Tax=Streptomyces sodiiphilus TaxID=226217 RepID=A0ABP5AX86_9ACTN
MPCAIPFTVPAGSLSSGAQPSIASRDGSLVLRPWRAGDAPVLVRAFQDPGIGRWHMRQVATPEEARRWITDSAGHWEAERAAQWAITRGDDVDGEVLGRMSLRWMDLLHGAAECAYWVLPEARGTGVATRALRALAGWALDDIGFRRLELAHSVHNEASCRVAVKSGFVQEGVRRSAMVHADGRHDMHLHARIPTDPCPAP